MKKMNLLLKIVLLVGFMGLFLIACGGGEKTPTITVPGSEGAELVPSLTETSTSTPSPPTPTPEPMALLVNGSGITMREYQAELERYKQVVGRDLNADDQQKVLDNFIAELLLAQGAKGQGFVVTDEALQERMTKLVASRGGESGFQDWLSKHYYDQDSFETALTRSMYAAWMRDQIVAEVPEAMEQVHVQQIRLNDPQEAELVLNRLKAGADFSSVAYEYDPLTGGDLGWFPRGYLFDRALEEAAFSLQVGQFSEVIETESGYHILYLIERDSAYPLAPEARQKLQLQAVRDWLEKQTGQSEIQILIQ